MCGRFTNKATAEQIKQEFKIGKLNPQLFTPRYNIAPSQTILAVIETGGERLPSYLKWGLIPSWSKDGSITNRPINARAETLSERPSFRTAFKQSRCIIPASGFYEWQKQPKGAKQPFYFYLTEKEVFGFAGLREEWIDTKTGELVESCAIITTAANEVLAPIHDRMPVILDAINYDLWLAPEVGETEILQKLLVPYPAAKMKSHPVSRSVNSPAEDSPQLIENNL